MFDHFPLRFDFGVENESTSFSPGEYVNWTKVSNDDKLNIAREVDCMIQQHGLLHSETLSCCDLSCQDECHKMSLDNIFFNLKAILKDSTAQYRFIGRNDFRVVPGWNENVKQYHALARHSFLK